MKTRLSLLIGLIACAFMGQATVHNVTVGVPNNQFAPSSLTITAGDTVTWTNAAGFHNVNGTTGVGVGNPETFGNGAAATGTWTYSKQFTIAGTYNYQCDPHAGIGMTGSITVNPAPATGLPIQSFEASGDTWMYTNTPAAYNMSSDVWDSVSSLSSITPSAGANFWGMRDLDNPNGGGSFGHTLDFAAVSMAGLTNANIVFDYYTIGFDTSDSLAYVAEFNNGTTWGPLTELNKNTNAWTQVSIPVPGGSTHARLRIYAKQNGGSDYAAIDNVRIDTTLAPPPPAPGLPNYTIASVTTNDVAGVADSSNVVCRLFGVVHSADFDGNAGYDFYIYDNTGGIAVRSFSDIGTYQVAIGDSLALMGSIDQFNGLTRIRPDSLRVLAQNVVLQSPQLVTTLDETTEGEYIRMNGMQLVNPSLWPVAAGGSVNLDIYNATDTVTMRIDSDVNLNGSPAPTGLFDVIGSGGQFDFSSPFTSGYQIFPSSTASVLPQGPVIGGLPTYPIASVTTNDAAGAADSANVDCRIIGVVHSVDFDGNAGYEFYVYDNTGGMAVRSFSDIGTYQVTVGDSLALMGSIDQFNGLTRMRPDSLTLISSGNALIMPNVVTTLNESTEGEYIRMNGMQLVDPTQWPVTPGGSVNLQIYNTTDTVTMRIDSDVNLNGSPAPVGLFDVIGAGGQFDFSSPFTSGYQIFPSTTADIIQLVPTTPTISFAVSQQVEKEDIGTVTIDLLINPTSPNAETIDLQAALGAGVTVPGDGSITPLPNLTTGLFTLNIPANEDSVSFTISVVDDAIMESNETLFVSMNAVSAGLAMGVNNNFTFVIEDNDTPIPSYNIADVTTVDANGISDSVGVECRLHGVVFTDDFDGNAGVSFYIYDNTGGINIFEFDDVPTAAGGNYVVTRGDSIAAIGSILMFSGLAELQVDSIRVISTGNALKAPAVVTDLNESTESEYIRMNGVTLVDPTQWPTVPTSSTNLEITNLTDTFTLRIDSDVNLNGSPAPVGFFDVVGVGGQFDASAPHTDGYQILPRDLNDIIITLPKLAVTEIMPSSNQSNLAGDWFELTNYGSDPIDINGFSWDDNSQTPGTHTFGGSFTIAAGESVIVLDEVNADVAAWLANWGQSTSGLRVIAKDDLGPIGFSGLSSGGDEVNLYDDNGALIQSVGYLGTDVTAGFSIQVDTNGVVTGASVDGVDGAYTSLGGDVGNPGNLPPTFSIDEFLLNNIDLYPNPANKVVFVGTESNVAKVVEVRSMTGATLAHMESTAKTVEINVKQLPAGVYIITLEMDGKAASRKLIVE